MMKNRFSFFPYLTQSSREQAIYGYCQEFQTQLEIKSGDFQV